MHTRKSRKRVHTLVSSCGSAPSPSRLALRFSPLLVLDDPCPYGSLITQCRLPVRRGALLAALPDHQEALHHGRCRTHARTSSTRKARPPRHHRRGPALPITTKTHARACEMDACCYGRDRCLSGRLVLIACSLWRNAVRWRYWMLWPKLANASRWPHACCLSHVGSRAVVRVLSQSARFSSVSGRHLSIARRLLHVRHCLVPVAHCLLHVNIICSLCSICMLHIEGSTSSVPH